MPAVSLKLLFSRACRSDDPGLQVFHGSAAPAGRARSDSELS
jgi:hypothetical protein